jgi:hypothetical protein
MSLQQKPLSSQRADNINTTRLTVSSTATVRNLLVCNLQYDQLCPPPPGFNTWIAMDVKPQGLGGGDFFAGSWQTRDLNTLSGGSGGVSLVSNQLRFQPGTYHIRVRAPAFRVWQHKARFHNVTLDFTEAYGTSEQAREDTSNFSEVEFILTVSSASHFYEVQHQCDTSQLVNGFGVACDFPDAEELYTVVYISQITYV